MTIIPRNGKFGVKVWDPGRKRYRWVGSFDTEAEAIRAEADANLQPGRDVPTVEQWVRNLAVRLSARRARDPAHLPIRGRTDRGDAWCSQALGHRSRRGAASCRRMAARHGARSKDDVERRRAR